MKKERIIYIVIFILIAVLTFLTGHQAFLAAALVLASYLLLSGIYTVFAGRKTETWLDCDPECRKAEEKEVVFSIRNNSILPLLRVEILFNVENLLTKEKTALSFTCVAGPKRTRKLSFTAGDHFCGCLLLKAEMVRCGDPLWLFSKVIQSEDCRTQMMVLPELSEYPLSAEELEGYDMESFRFSDARTGTDSSETIGIREYLPGDSVRTIHWKLSAKTDSVLVKEYGYPVDVRLLVLAEKSLPASKFSETSDGTIELLKRMESLTELSLSVSNTLLQMGIEHTFGWYHAEDELFITKRICEQENIFQLMPEFLSAPFYCQGKNAALHFLESAEEKNYAGYVYIADPETKIEEGLESLKEYGQITVLTPESFQ